MRFPIEAYKNLGNAAFNQGKVEEAQAYYRRALELDPNNYEASYNLGVVLQMQGKIEEAIASYRRTLSLNPNYHQAANNLGVIFQKQGFLEKAQACYSRAITLNPNDHEAANNLGVVFQTQGKLEEALTCYRHTLTLDPNQPKTYYNLGVVLQMQGKPEEALTCYSRAFALEPNQAKVHNNIGFILHMQGKLEEARAWFDRAIEIDPDYGEAHFNRALILLQSGEYKEGFVECEWHWRLQNTPRRYFGKPLWNGEDLADKTILIHQYEQGFGDTIQFIRYVPLVQQYGGHIVVECHKPLVRLLTTVPGVSQVISTGTTLPEFDVQTPLLSLPRILGTTLETIPVQIPYLIPPLSSIQIPLPAGTQFKIGIVWASGYYQQALEASQNYHKRSCPLSLFIELLAIDGISLYSLQIGRNSADIDGYRHETRLQDLSNQIDDFADTAAAIAQLDLVISVDTAVAHLAGALGKPVWVLLPFVPDWRWLFNREDSPWYPSMRLFCQEYPGDWSSVFAKVFEKLHSLVKIT